MTTRIEWRGREAQEHVNRRIVAYLTRAAMVVAREAKRMLSVPGTGRRGKGGLVERHAGGGGKRVYGAFPSAPGEPPHKQTGHLRRSVTYEVDDATLEARVGTNLMYGKHLELGTRRGLAPRPWLRPALARTRTRVNELLAAIGRDD